MLQKRGVSPVIATVLLVVITLVAIGILAAFVIPFVNKSLSNEDCFNILGNLKFEDSSYSCYVNDNPGRTGFSIRVDNKDIVGFKTVFYSGGSSEPVEIINSTDGTALSPEVRMLGNSTNLVLPKTGGVRTYVVHGIYEKIELYPILSSGTTCDQSDILEDITRCLDSGIVGQLRGS